MNHDPSDPVQEGPADWVVTCACGHRAEASHPATAVGKHAAHQSIEAARTALRNGEMESNA